MRIGDIVVILTKLDSRIRNQTSEELIVGTLDQIMADKQVSVLLPNGDIWTGPEKFIVPFKEQE